ncbi:hypothetical protein FEM03_15880 [Phragmitibacter flavus]|uniref:Uncharacterized protein n=1 Tax=Phragmitibacter flavus TaxID=2576071 RepID=A0A5R8KBX6_9BACT|nr:hypothetical protein [Phragmitibacter flavus]TLD69802.1 hypothetical protein FEM03_15880 [Phragmitibacter flavus]
MPRLPLLAFAALLLAAIFSPASAQAQAQFPSNGEHLIISGGVALRKWENLRAPGTQHDRWWGNFIRPARVRIQQIQKQNPNALITWMVYRNAYTMRSAEDQRDLIALVESVRDAYRVRLVWFNSGDQVISHINNGQNRSRTKIVSFEYYGHSNKYCFMFDYSSAIYGASKGYLHQRDLSKISSRAFAKGAFVKSWGCHTGESMSGEWRRVTGLPMIGAIGKTDYTDPVNVSLSPGSRWTN